MRAGKLTPQDVDNIVYDTWVKLYETTLTATATTLTISGLTGDTAKEYKLGTEIVWGSATPESVGVRFNNDSGTNYGHQWLIGNNTSASAARAADTKMFFYYNNPAQNELTLTDAIFNVTSGYVRTGIIETTQGIATTTVEEITLIGGSWNNTADEVTSLVLVAGAAGGLGVGSNITLWKRAYAT